MGKHKELYTYTNRAQAGKLAMIVKGARRGTLVVLDTFIRSRNPAIAPGWRCVNLKDGQTYVLHRRDFALPEDPTWRTDLLLHTMSTEYYVAPDFQHSGVVFDRVKKLRNPHLPRVSGLEAVRSAIDRMGVSLGDLGKVSPDGSGRTFKN